MLTLRPGALVRVEQVIDALWGDEPPAAARKSVQNQIVRIRQCLGHDAVTTEPEGYRLLVETDAAQFEHLARVDPGVALSMWRGDPWPELEDWDPARAARAHLIELKLDAEERAVERRLDVAAAQRLVDDAPLREHRWCILLRALHASGRQADALRAAQRVRQLLRDELGLEPGEELRATELAVARGELDNLTPTAITPDDARALGAAAYDREEYVLAAQWLRVSGSAPEALIALAMARFGAGDAAAGIDVVTQLVDRAFEQAAPNLAVEALVALAVGRGPAMTTPEIDRAFAATRAWAADLGNDDHARLAASEVVARAYNAPASVLEPLIDRLEVCRAGPLSPRAASLTAIARVIALARPHDADRRLELVDQIPESDDADVDRLARFFRQHVRVWSLLELGNPAHAAARADLLAETSATRHAAHRAVAAAYAGQAILDGNPEDAEREAFEWMGPYAAHEGPGLAATVHASMLFVIRWMQGRLHELLPLLERAASAMPDVPTWRSALAMAWASAGRATDAREALRPFFRDGLRIDVGFGLWSATLFHLVEAVVQVGEQSEAALLIDVIEPIADRHAFYAAQHLGSFHHHLGALHRALGDAARARDHYALAIRAHETLGSKWWAAHSRQALATLGRDA